MLNVNSVKITFNENVIACIAYNWTQIKTKEKFVYLQLRKWFI